MSSRLFFAVPSVALLAALLSPVPAGAQYIGKAPAVRPAAYGAHVVAPSIGARSTGARSTGARSTGTRPSGVQVSSSMPAASLESRAEVSSAGNNAAAYPRVNNLACLEALLGMVVNGVQFVGVASGVGMSCLAWMLAGSDTNLLRAKLVRGGLTTGVSLCLPSLTSSLLEAARNASLFQ